MKKILWILLNKSFKKDLELLYGKGSSVDIFEVKKCTTNKLYLVNCKLNLTDPDLYVEVGSEGLTHLLAESWVYTGMEDEKFVLTVSYEIIL